MLATRLKSLGPWLIGLLAGAIVLSFLPHISRNESHSGRMVLAGIALLLVHTVFAWRGQAKQSASKEAKPLDGFMEQGGPQSRGSKALTALWLGTALYGAFNYYQRDLEMLTEVGDYADATYYYLNSKYFEEIGYDNLYEAMLVADAEGPKRLVKIVRYRDLTNYKDLHPRSYALRRAEQVKAHFSPERWEAFCRDLSFITKHGVAGGFDYFFIDHGYNPPPPWTFVGGTLSNLVAVENMKWLTSIDIVLVIGLMVVIARSFGLPAMLVALVFFLTTFSGRWPVLGQSILRFDWLCALVGAACALKSKRHGLAGAGLAYAACNRIFPGIFALPYLAWIAHKWWSEKKMPRELMQFATGAAIVATIVVGGAWLRYGTPTFEAARERLAMHGGPESFSSHRVGLGHVALYRGEWTRKEINKNGGIDGKRADLWAIFPKLKLAGALALLAVLVYAWRSKEEPHRLIWLSIYPLFCLTNPQINYYNLRLLLVLFHAERWRDPLDRIGLSILFVTEVATQWVHVDGADRYAVTATTSYGLLVYLLTMAVGLALQGREPASEKVASEAVASPVKR